MLYNCERVTFSESIVKWRFRVAWPVAHLGALGKFLPKRELNWHMEFPGQKGNLVCLFPIMPFVHLYLNVKLSFLWKQVKALFSIMHGSFCAFFLVWWEWQLWACIPTHAYYSWLLWLEYEMTSPQAHVLNTWFCDSWWNYFETWWKHLPGDPSGGSRSLGAGPRSMLSLSTCGVVLFPSLLSLGLLGLAMAEWMPWSQEINQLHLPPSCHARVLVWMWSGTHRLSCLNCPQIVEALFAGQGGRRNIWDTGSSRRSGSLERALMFLCASGQWKPHCKLLCDVQSHFKFQASLVGWTNFPETVSQDKWLLSQTARFSFVRYWP